MIRNRVDNTKKRWKFFPTLYYLFIDYYFLTDSIIPSAKPAIP